MPSPPVGRRSILAAGIATLAGCQTTPQTPRALTLGPNRTGYMLLAAPINTQSAIYFSDNINKMLDQGATEIRIGINSPGGVIRAALAMIDQMDKVHTDRKVTFVTHNVGLVASAACYVFLAGQKRYAIPRGTFLFHEAGVVANGMLTSPALREAYDRLQGEERIFLNLLKTRTRLTEGEASSFVRRTVILSAAEAMRDGITDGTQDFIVPTGVPVAAIRTNPPASTTRPAGAPTG